MSPVKAWSTRLTACCLALLAALVMFLSPDAAAQGTPRTVPEHGSNTLTIQVMGWGGAGPASMIHVELVNGDRPRNSSPGPFGFGVREGYCDSGGFRSFIALPDGDYTVYVTAPGAVVPARSVRLLGSTQEQLVYQLHPTAARGRDENSDTVSVQWLGVPEKARKRYAQAKEDYDRGRYDSAVKELQTALTVHPGFVIANNLLGLTWWRMQKLDLARESFETSLRLDPRFLPSYLGYAEMLTELRDFERAGQVLDQAARRLPESPDLYYVMAKMQFASGKLDPAEQNCRRVLERNRNKIPDVHLVLSNIYLRRNRLDQVATELEAYLVQAPLGSFAKVARESLAKIKTQTARAKER